MAKSAVVKTAPIDAEMYKTFQEDQGAGFENVTGQDVAMPFVYILQSNSPQVADDKGKPGEFWHTVKKQSLGKKLKVVPVTFRKMYVEWVPRESNGGFVAYHDDPEILNTCTRNDKNQDVLPNGNYIVTTAYHFCLNITEDNPEAIIISMSSTALKHSRRWMSMARGIKLNIEGKIFTPPLFSHSYIIEPLKESNNKGSWFGFHIHTPEIITSAMGDVYQLSKGLSKEAGEDISKMLPTTAEDGYTNVEHTADTAAKTENGGDAF